MGVMPVAWIMTLLMLTLLVRAPAAMEAARTALAMFAGDVLPGLFPYMVAAQLLVSRMGRRMTPSLLLALGWAGGSPTGARLVSLCPGLSRGEQRRVAVRCATVSPMFLWGTLGQWLASPRAALCVLAGVLLGGWLAAVGMRDDPAPAVSGLPGGAASLSGSIAAAAETMLRVCGAMVFMQVTAALVAGWTERLCPALSLPVTALMEVAAGAKAVAALPLPLAWRAALIAGAAGWGGVSLMLQVRSALPEGVLSVAEQVSRQALHGAVAFAVTLGLMLV